MDEEDDCDEYLHDDEANLSDCEEEAKDDQSPKALNEGEALQDTDEEKT